MVPIMSLAQITLSRPSTQSPAASSPPSAHPLPTRPATNENYYLSDDQLVTVRTKPGRSAAHSQANLSILSTHPSTANLAPAHEDLPALPVLSPVTLSHALAPSLARRCGHNILVPPMATVACGHAIQPPPHISGAHRPLLSTLLSVSARANSPLQVPSVAPKLQIAQHEASHVSKVGTRLKELVNRVFPSNADNGLTFLGRMAPRPHLALEFGEALKHELTSSGSDSYTSRAILRTAVIPALTIYICRLEPLLVPVSTHPLGLFVPKNGREVDISLPLVLNYNIEVIRSAWTVRNSVEEICGGYGDGHVSCWEVWVHGLRPFVNRLDAIIQRFMGPYLLEIKTQVMDKISQLRLSPNHYVVDHQVSREAEVGRPILLSPIRGVPLSFISRNRSPSILSATASWVSSTPTSAPFYSSHNLEMIKELGSMLEGIRKILLVRLACGSESKKWMVSIASQAVWKAMLAFASRPVSTFSSSSASSTTTTAVLGLQPLDSAAMRSARQLLRGPVGIKQASITKSPEYLVYQELAKEVKAFGTVIEEFVKDIAGLDSTVRLNDGDEVVECVFCKLGFLVVNNENDQDEENGDLVREAMNEALSAFSSFKVVLLGLLHPSQLLTCLKPISPSSLTKSKFECQTLRKALQEIPPIIFLHLLASRIPKFKVPNLIWGLSWDEYSNLLKSFTVADQVWTFKIGKTMLIELNRLIKEEDDREKENSLCCLSSNQLVRPIEMNLAGASVVGEMGLVLKTCCELILTCQI